MNTRKPKTAKSKVKDEIEVAIIFGAEGGNLEVERATIEGVVKYRLHYYDGSADFLNEEDRAGLDVVDQRSEWFPDLEQALASSRWEWWMMSLAKIAPDLMAELLRIINASPEIKSCIEERPLSFRRLKEKKEKIPSIEEIQKLRAEDDVPARSLWSSEDRVLGMTKEDEDAVINARAADWDYNGTDGYEPKAAKAILDKYTLKRC
jgi:hypothetical protein